MKNSITVDGVTYYREQPALTKAKQVLEKYEWLVSEITRARENAQGLYDDMKDQGLQFSTIESEGYLRGMIQIDELVKHINECIDHEPTLDDSIDI